jgi:hypothetical protein
VLKDYDNSSGLEVRYGGSLDLDWNRKGGHSGTGKGDILNYGSRRNSECPPFSLPFFALSPVFAPNQSTGSSSLFAWVSCGRAIAAKRNTGTEERNPYSSASGLAQQR